MRSTCVAVEVGVAWVLLPVPSVLFERRSPVVAALLVTHEVLAGHVTGAGTVGKDRKSVV